MSSENNLEVSLGSLKAIPEAKLVTFAIGQQKKTRFQKLRDAKEMKEKQDAEEAAIVYQSFAASFNEQEDDVKTFVRSGANANGSGGAVYKVSKTTEMDKLMNEMKERDNWRDQQTTTHNNSRGNRQIDQLLNELKSGTLDRPGSDAPSSSDNGGSFDTGDLNTTNIYLGNLAPSVTEKGLHDLFSHYGSINSIKIMWPRNEDERARNRHCGFVSFKKRRDAEDAMSGLLDFDYQGYRMTMNWGKAVRVTNEPYQASSSVLPSPVSPPTFNSTISNSGITSMPSFKPLTEVTDTELSGMSVDNLIDSVRQTMEPDPHHSRECVTIQVVMPKDTLLRGVIDTTAKAVASGGVNHETIIKKQTMNAKHYEFLRSPDTDDWYYYQWRTHAYIKGENDNEWSMKPFQFTPEGPFLVPPHTGLERNVVRRSSPSPDRSGDRKRQRDRDTDNYSKEDDTEGASKSAMTGAQMERERHKKRAIQMARLNNSDYREWKLILSKLTFSRDSIKEAMGFAFDKIESSEEIISMIKEHLIVGSERAAAKVAGLFLLSDILHNSGSSIKLAAHYRSVVQNIVPEVIDNLSELLRNTKGRMSAFQIEDRVKKVFNVWTDWSIFPTLFLIGLQALLYFNESECTAMQQYVGIKNTDSATASVSESEIEILRKRAKATGIAHTDKTSPYELQYKLDFIERFSKNAMNSLTAVNTAYPEVIVTSEVPSTSQPVEQISSEIVSTVDDDDVDGIPMPFEAVPVSTAVPRNGLIPVNAVDVDDDDIDGIPLSGAVPEDDIDGVPLEDTNVGDSVDGDDIDGLPMEEDIDGIPL